MDRVLSIGAGVSLAIGLGFGLAARPQFDILTDGPRQVFSDLNNVRTSAEIPFAAASTGGYDFWGNPPPAIDDAPVQTLASLDAKAEPDGAGEQSQVLVRYDQGRDQIDDLAHGPDPRAQVSEPAAKPADVDGVRKLDHADRAHDPDIDDSLPPPARYETLAQSRLNSRNGFTPVSTFDQVQ